VHARHDQPLTRTAQLAEIVASAVPTREPGKHPATRTFQAIRIRVNNELQEIETALDGTLTALAPAGRLCAISFHSLEDAIVKRFIQKHCNEDPIYAGLPEVPAHARPKLRRIGRAVHASPAEIAVNVRSRSAIMRAAERLA
jgi:16S rRNA (cytosine1402-N4)-methyltransferase